MEPPFLVQAVDVEEEPSSKQSYFRHRGQGMKEEMNKDTFEGMDRRSFLRGMTLGTAATFVVPAAATGQSGEKAVQMESGEKIDTLCHRSIRMNCLRRPNHLTTLKQTGTSRRSLTWM